MTIDTQTIIKLRTQTGAGMMECQQALEEANGDMDKAIEILRKKGAAKAAKKAERVTKEGVIAVAIASDHKKGSLAAVNCETDFVARNEDFITFAKELADKYLAGADAEAEFNAHQQELVLKIGENITFGKAELVEGAYVTGYLHANKKVAGLVVFNQEVPEELAYDIAMQVVAGQPAYYSPAEIPTEELAKEKEVYGEQLKNENKPETVKEKIIEGKLAKYYEEVCLLNQKFIKDDSITIKQLLEKAGANIRVERFVRYQI